MKDAWIQFEFPIAEDEAEAKHSGYTATGSAYKSTSLLLHVLQQEEPRVLRSRLPLALNTEG